MEKSILAQEEETRKKEIIKISLKIVDKYGIKKLTVARIAREVGFSESALYRHFRCKKELISMIIDSAYLDVQSHYKEIKNKAGNSMEALRLVLRKHLEYLALYPGLFRVIYSDEIHMGESFLLDKFHFFTNATIRSVKKIISQGMKEGVFRKDINLSLAAIHFLGIIQTAFSFWTIKDRKISLIRAGDKLLLQFLSGIKA